MKPRFLFGVRPGVKGICAIEPDAGLLMGSSSCKADNGFRCLAAKNRNVP